MNNVLERIELHSLGMSDSECWLSDYVKNLDGYACICSDGRRPMLHRVAYEAYYAEPIPDGMLVCHTCDNPGCFNPEHLFLGTHQDNVLDQIAKGRRTQAGMWSKPKP